MEGRLVTIWDGAGHCIARARVGCERDGRNDLIITEGAAELRSAYFLSGLHAVCCRTENCDDLVHARIFTRWEQNRRVWSIAFPGDAADAEAAPSRSPVVAA